MIKPRLKNSRDDRVPFDSMGVENNFSLKNHNNGKSKFDYRDLKSGIIFFRNHSLTKSKVHTRSVVNYYQIFVRGASSSNTQSEWIGRLVHAVSRVLSPYPRLNTTIKPYLKPISAKFLWTVENFLKLWTWYWITKKNESKCDFWSSRYKNDHV